MFTTGPEGGCTLVEALTAITVLALGTVLLAGASLYALGVSDGSRKAARALVVAQDRIELLRSRPWAEVTASCDGQPNAGSAVEAVLCRVQRRGREYALRLERIRSNPHLDRYTVQCRWEDGAGGRSLFLETAVERKP